MSRRPIFGIVNLVIFILSLFLLLRLGPLSGLIRNSFNFIDRVYSSISPSNYYLDAIQLGMEFNDNNGTAILGYTLYYWALNNVTLIGQSH